MYIVGVPEFLDSYLPYLLRRADQALSASFYAVLAERGVGRSEWRVLAVLEDLGELSVLDLADAALSPQPTVTHALRRLEERGLIQRTRGKSDKRNRFITITPAGSRLTRALIADARELETGALADCGSLDELITELRKLTNSIEMQRNAANQIGARS
jgi:DNA-binding MarR family transcriptional regulator